MLRYSLLFFLQVFTFSAFAQPTMGEVLKNMPDSLLPYLSHNNRLDCIDFCEANMKGEVRNELDGKSVLSQLTADYALFRLNEASKMELFLLETGSQSDSIVCVIQTYGTDLCESIISFYSIVWQQLPVAKYLPESTKGLAAHYDAELKVLTLESSNYLERPALEEQHEAVKVLIKLKWKDGTFNKI
jgi:hypothetical protein